LTRGGSPPNDETDPAKRRTLDALREKAKDCRTPAYFENQDQLKFEVVAALQAWDKKGRPGSRKIFASVEEYFADYAPQPDRPLLFDFSQTLLGRDQQSTELREFLASPTLAVAVLIGRGGIGKTRLLKALADAVGDQRSISFLRRGAVWHRESDKEVPAAGDLLLVADDAHRDADLPRLMQCFNDARRTGRKAQLILSCRPSGLDAVDSVVARTIDPSMVVRLPPLARLSTGDVRRLAQEELGPYADPGIVEWLVSISSDTPLVTVAAARMIRRDNLHPSQIRSDDDFQHIVFDRFIDELDDARRPFPMRKLIELIAALGPESFTSESLVGEIASSLQCQHYEARQSIQCLEERGLLIWDGRGGLRIAPDVLSDRVLERCCVAQNRSSGFADYVVRKFAPYGKTSQILANLAEIDWRLVQSSNGQVSILDGVWSILLDQFRDGNAGTRCEILSTIKSSAIYKPVQAMEACRIAMTTDAPDGGDLWTRQNSDVLKALPEILGSVSYHSDWAKQAFELLLDLWRRGVHEAATVAKDLAKLRPIQHQPGRTGEVLDAIEASIDDGSLYGPERSILDLIDEILEREIEWTRSDEAKLELLTYPLVHSAFRLRRERCLNMLERCLASAELRVALRALQSLLTVLGPTVMRFGLHDLTPEEAAWQDAERLTAINILSRRALDPCVDLVVQQQIFANLRMQDRNWHRPEVEEALSMLTAQIPTFEAFTSFDAFVTPYWAWEQPTADDGGLQEARYNEWLNAAVDRFVSHHSTSSEQIARLEEMMMLFQQSGIGQGASGEFVSAMCRRHPEFLTTFVEYVARSPLPALGYEIRAVATLARNAHLEAYVQLGLKLASHATAEVALGVADGIRWSDEEGVVEGDLEIIARLAEHQDMRVRIRPLRLAGRAGRKQEHSGRAASILASIRVAHFELGGEFWSAIGRRGTPVEAFNEEQMRAVLGNLVSNNQIDHHRSHSENLLQDVAARWPHLVAGLLTDRLETSLTKDGNYSPWGGLNLAQYFRSMPGSPHLPLVLRRIRDIDAKEGVPSYSARELYWAIAGNDERAIEVLNAIASSISAPV
jgi:hypothetical protein